MYQKWLEAFHHVARARSFTAAASHLNVGQPTISTHVSNLEGHFGVELFHRKGRTIQLTPAGETLYAITHDMFGHEQEAISYLKSLKSFDVGELNFSAVRPYDVMELLVALKERRPGVKCAVRLRSSEDVVSDLMGFDADIGVVSREITHRDIHSVFYKRHRVYVVVHRGHRLAGRGQVSMADLDGENMIVRTTSSTTQDAFDHAAEKAGITINPVFEIESREGVREAVIRGLGIGVLSETVFSPHPEIHPLTVLDADISTQAFIVCLAARKNRPLIREVLTMADGMMGKVAG
jgi:LysR family transcriptional regulator, low CO2-responsive transcriptional regulator